MKFRFACILLVLCNKLLAQDLTTHFRHLSTRDGLSSDNIICFYKDSRGFLWLGTKGDGLNRWDGIEVKQYKKKPGDSTSLIDNEVRSISEDGSGKIWIATAGGLSIMGFDNKFKNYKHIRSDTGHVDLTIGIFSVARFKGHMYLGLSNGIVRVSGDASHAMPSGELLNKGKIPEVLRCIPNGMHITSTGLWISTFKGMYYSKNGRDFQHRGYNPDKIRILDMGFIPAFCESKSKKIMFMTWGFSGVYQYTPSTGKLDSVQLSEDVEFSPMSMIQVDDNIYWASTMLKGLVEIDLGKKSFRYFHPDPDIPGSLSNDGVTHLYRDEQDVFFVSTGFGVDYVHASQCNFTQVKLTVPKDLAFPTRSGYQMMRDSRNRLWVGSFNRGLYRISEDGTVFHANLKGDEQSIWTMNEIDGQLILGTYAGLGYYNIQADRFDKITLPAEIEEVVTNGITFLKRDQHKNWILGIWQFGLVILSPDLKTFKSYVPDDGSGVVEFASPFGGITDSQDRLWYGYQESTKISCLDLSTKKARLYSTVPPRSELDHGHMNGMLLREPYIYITTSNSGLLQFHMQTHNTRVYNSAGALPCDNLNAIGEDRQGTFWITSTCGLIKFDPVKGSSQTYHYTDGLPTEYIEESGFLLDHDGSALITSDKFLMKFYPNSFISNPHFPRIAVTSIRIAGKEVPVVPGQRELHLYYRDKIISFEFTGINFIDPEKNRYSYFLKGFDKTWTQLGTYHSVNFTTLPPGDYTLLLKCTNKSGTSNPQHLEYIIHVHGPFWKTWWFILLVILFFTGIIYLIYRNRIHQIYQLQYMRDKISQDLHDDIGSALSSISIYSDVLKKMTGNAIPEVIPILNNMHDTAKQAMENMSDIVWAINPKNDRFPDILKRLEIFANQILSAKGTKFILQIPEDITTKPLTLHQRRNIYLICKEAINNVAKYAEAQECTFQIVQEKNNIVIHITDNGKGIQSTANNLGGNGIKNMKKRIEDINGFLEIISGKPKGTRVILKLAI